MRGMIVEILRPASGHDSSNCGVTSFPATDALLVGVAVPQLFEAGAKPVLELRARMVGERVRYADGTILTSEARRQPYYYAVPAAAVGHTMFGGNFIYSSDSRFRDICSYPIPVHDRKE